MSILKFRQYKEALECDRSIVEHAFNNSHSLSRVESIGHAGVATSSMLPFIVIPSENMIVNREFQIVVSNILHPDPNELITRGHLSIELKYYQDVVFNSILSAMDEKQYEKFSRTESGRAQILKWQEPINRVVVAEMTSAYRKQRHPDFYFKKNYTYTRDPYVGLAYFNNGGRSDADVAVGKFFRDMFGSRALDDKVPKWFNLELSQSQQ